MWDSDCLPDLKPKIGPPLYITGEMVSKVIAKMKTGKAAGLSGIVIKMIKSTGKEIVKSIANLANRIIKEGVIASDWNLSYIISLYNNKGDSLSRDSCRVDQVKKIMLVQEIWSWNIERILKNSWFSDKISGWCW